MIEKLKQLEEEMIIKKEIVRENKAMLEEAKLNYAKHNKNLALLKEQIKILTKEIIYNNQLKEKNKKFLELARVVSELVDYCKTDLDIPDFIMSDLYKNGQIINDNKNVFLAKLITKLVQRENVSINSAKEMIEMYMKKKLISKISNVKLGEIYNISGSTVSKKIKIVNHIIFNSLWKDFVLYDFQIQ